MRGNSLPVVTSRHSREAPITLILVVTLAVALAFRLWGIGFGLPYRYHVDEQAYIPQAALLCSGKVDLPPWSFGPNLYLITLCGVDIMVYGTGILTGAWASLQGFQTAYSADPSLLYIANRSVSAVIGTATVYLVFLLGRQLDGRRIGVMAACFLALSFLHVRDSHYAVPDIFATFWVVLGALAAIRASQHKSWRDVALAGGISGVAAGVKFSVVAGVVMTVVAMCLASLQTTCKFQERIAFMARGLAVLIASFIVGFVVGYPNALKLLLAPGDLLQDITFQLTFMNQVLAHIKADSAPAWLFYFKVLGWGLGPPLAVVCIGGGIHAIYRRSDGDLVVLSFLTVYYLLIGLAPWYTAHYALPLIPFLCLFGSQLLWAVAEKLPSERWRTIVVSIVGLLVLLPSVASTVRANSLLTNLDTRTEAKWWIESNIPAGTRIGMSLYTPWAPSLSTPDEPIPYSAHTYDVVLLGYDMADHNLDDYRRDGIDYLIASSFVWELAWRDDAREAKKLAFYATLDADTNLVKEFRPYNGAQVLPFIHDEVYGPAISLWQRERPGPTIKIYRINP